VRRAVPELHAVLRGVRLEDRVVRPDDREAEAGQIVRIFNFQSYYVTLMQRYPRDPRFIEASSGICCDVIVRSVSALLGVNHAVAFTESLRLSPTQHNEMNLIHQRFIFSFELVVRQTLLGMVSALGRRLQTHGKASVH
jgi:hypothetical protein